MSLCRVTKVQRDGERFCRSHHPDATDPRHRVDGRNGNTFFPPGEVWFRRQFPAAVEIDEVLPRWSNWASRRKGVRVTWWTQDFWKCRPEGDTANRRALKSQVCNGIKKRHGKKSAFWIFPRQTRVHVFTTWKTIVGKVNNIIVTWKNRAGESVTWVFIKNFTRVIFRFTPFLRSTSREKSSSWNPAHTHSTKVGCSKFNTE